MPHDECALRVQIEAPSDTIARVCRQRSISVDTLRGRDRSRWVSDARREVCRTLHASGMSLEMIGRLLGGRDHSTIRYLLRE